MYLEHFGKIDSSATANAGTSFTSSYLTANDQSKFWGNYTNATFKLNQGFYTTTTNSNTTVTWNTTNEAKGTTTSWLCTTGASEQNKTLNIYDFAGNETEWTLERYSDANYPCVDRGGTFLGSSNASNRDSSNTCGSRYYRSARPSLFIK